MQKFTTHGLFIMILSLIWGSSTAQNTEYSWTWINGSNSTRTSVFGVQGVPDANNIPGGGKTDMYTTDSNGNFWLFGGGLGSAVLWKNDGNGWAWIAGTSTDITGSGFYPDPVYGTQGIADPANRPSVRSGGTIGADSNGNIWLFGGYGGDASGNLNTRLNDLWKFDGTNWTWVSGSQFGNQTAVYGTKGSADPANIPGSRSGHVMWIDDSDNIWIFGGDGWATTTPNGGQANRLNDLWKYDGTNWTWMAGSNGYFQQGIFGTKGVGDPNNTPGARYDGNAWKGNDGDLYLFGGVAHGQVSSSGSTSSLSPINDLWKFDGTNWIWLKGADTLRSVGVSGTKGVAHPDNEPSGRAKASVVKLSNGEVLVHAGYGIEPSTGSYYKELSDTWVFDGTDWRWQSGPNTANESPNFGTKGVEAPSNTPGSRHSAAIWQRNDELFFFGGRANHGSSYNTFGLNDYWIGINQLQQDPLAISKIYPKFAPAGSELFIYGAGFSTTISDQYVEIGGISATITDVNNARITIEVPELNPGLHTVSVTKDGETKELINAFQFLLPSAAYFESQQFLFSMNDIINLNSGDFNNNGDIDLIMNSGALNDVDIRYNNQNFQFTSLTNIHSGFENHDVHPVDIDKDGDLDAVASLITQNTPTNSADDRLVWFRNNGPESNPTYTELPISTSINGARDIFPADLDGDGDEDIIATSSVTGTITWFRNDDAFFAESFNITTNAPGVSCVHAADLNNDGLMDVLSGTGSNQTVSWYPNEGNGVFTQKIDIISGEQNVCTVIAADFDNDGHMDVLTHGNENILWFRNDGTGDFTDRRFVTDSFILPTEYKAADLDGDGDQDVIAASFDNGTIAWFQNLGDGRFSEAIEMPTSLDRAYAIDAADYDNDGDIDVIVGQRFASDGPGAYLFENTSISNSPIASYPFSGNSNDASGNGYDLIPIGTPDLANDPGGNVDEAYFFNGESEFFETPVNTPFESQTFTYAMWLNPFAFALPNKTATFLSTQRNFETTGVLSFINSDGRIGTYINNGNGNNLAGFLGQFLNVGEWVHYALTYDGNRLQTYLNGQPTEGLDLGATVVYNGSTPLALGGNSRPENDFRGKMDEVLFYDQALSDSEIQAIYDSQVPTIFDNTSQWTSVITTDMNGKSSSAEFGTTPTSTDGFDASLDIPLPPAPTGDYLQLYFNRSDFGGSLGDKYRSDFKAFSDYETSNSHWQLSLFSTFAGNDTLRIVRPVGFTAPIKVIDDQGDEYVNFSGDLEFEYEISAGEILLFDIIVGDIFPPQLSLDAIMDGPQIWDKSLARTLSWTVTDPSGISNNFVEVSYDGGSNWQNIYSGTDNSYSFTPDPAITLNESTLFRVTATDGASSSFANSITETGSDAITIVSNTQDLNYSNGWQMVGSPFAGDIQQSSVLSDVIRYRWNTESFEYLLIDTYPANEGIWLGAYSDGSDQLVGGIGETDANVTLFAGWNMVTVPLFRDVNTDSILVFDGINSKTFSQAVSNFELTIPQKYNGSGYEIAENLEYFSSYWIGVTSDSLELTLPIHRFSPVLKQSIVVEDDELQLTVIDGEFEQQLVIRVGGEPSQPAPPPAPNAYKIGFIGESTILGNTYTQYSLSNSEQDGTEIPMLIEGPERFVTLKWQKTGFESVPITLKASDNYSLDSESGSIEISSTELSEAVLGIGDYAVSIEENSGLPESYKLNQNYPNPFNPSTNISFDIPKKSHVQIEVFNVTGQKVATVVDRTYTAGSFTVQFDASALSTGTYVYRIKAGNYTESRKMILIK